MWSKSGGTFSSDQYFTFANKASLTEGYQILCEPGDDVSVVEAATGLPQYGSLHDTVPNTYMRQVVFSPLGPYFWLAVVTYEGEISATAIDVEWTDTTTSEPIDRDWDGAAIVTANNEQVEGLSMDVSDQVVVIRRSFISINTKSIAAYRRATNADYYLGWPPGTARLVGFAAKNKFTYGAPLSQWDVTARIQFREPYANTTNAQAWYKRWRHEGVIVNMAGYIQRGVDAQGRETSKPVMLKADGTQEYNADNALYLHTQVYGSLPYSGLGLL